MIALLYYTKQEKANPTIRLHRHFDETRQVEKRAEMTEKSGYPRQISTRNPLCKRRIKDRRKALVFSCG